MMNELAELIGLGLTRIEAASNRNTGNEVSKMGEVKSSTHKWTRVTMETWGNAAGD